MTSTELTILNIGSTPSSDTLSLGRSVNRNENDISRVNFSVEIGGKEEISTPGFLDDFEQLGLVDWKFVGIPGINLLLRDIYNTNSDLFYNGTI